MSDQKDIWASIREKLDWEEVDYLNSVMDKQNNALKETGRNLEELQRLLGQLKESTLDIATDQFSQEIEAHEREEARDRMELSRRTAEPTDNAPASSIYDPDGELKPVPITLIAGDDTPAQHFTNTNVKQFIEKRLSLALVALQNSHSLNEPTTANLSSDQDDEEPAIETIGLYVEDLNMLLADISDMAVVVLED